MDTVPGRGTCFTLWLPPSAGVPQPRAAAPANDDTPRFSGTVLLVEDDALVRGLTADTLERCGFGVLVAASVDDALAIMQAHPTLDAVLSDVVMPGGKSGLDLRDTLRRLRPDLPVVLASGYADALVNPAADGDAADGEAAPVVIAKPYGAMDVARLLARQIDRRRAMVTRPGRPSDTGR